VPSGPLHFCGLSYVPRACWHTVASRLAQTLSRTERKFQTACCLVNFCPPASAQVGKSERKESSQIRWALPNTVICAHFEFIQGNLEELVRGASRRALRRRVSQLSRPRAAIGKAAVGFNLTSSANKKLNHCLGNNASNVAAFFGISFRLARRPTVVVAPQHRGVQFQLFSGGQGASRQRNAVRPNHSLKRRANSVPAGPLHFCGLSYVPRACWHTVGSRLAQTLGRAMGNLALREQNRRLSA